MDRSALASWLYSLRQAWESGQPQRMACLFTEEAAYQSHPFRLAVRGRHEIESLWKPAMAAREPVQVTLGTPVVEGPRAAVEYWALTGEPESVTTDAGVLLLHFEGGLCCNLREYWTVEAGTHRPPEGWGS